MSDDCQSPMNVYQRPIEIVYDGLCRLLDMTDEELAVFKKRHYKKNYGLRKEESILHEAFDKVLRRGE